MKVRLTFTAGGDCIVLASVPDYRQSDVNKSWVCPLDACGKKYPKPQLMFAHLDQHEDLHGQRVHLYTTYQDPNAPSPLHDKAIVFKSSSEYLIGSKKRERSVPQQRNARKKSRLSSLAAAAEAVPGAEEQQQQQQEDSTSSAHEQHQEFEVANTEATARAFSEGQTEGEKQEGAGQSNACTTSDKMVQVNSLDSLSSNDFDVVVSWMHAAWSSYLKYYSNHSTQQKANNA